VLRYLHNVRSADDAHLRFLGKAHSRGRRRRISD